MRKIAIFISGEAEASERLITLFNEGNRIRVDTVVTDGDPVALEQRFGQYGVEVIGIAPECSPEELTRIGEAIEAREPELYALDGYEGVMSGWVKEHHRGHVVTLTSADEAPREVVAALTAIDKADEHNAKADAPDAPKTADEEWAETLQIDFHTPPPVPHQAQPQAPVPPVPPVPPVQGPAPAAPRPNFSQNPQYARAPQGYGNRPVNAEPMPPTYLVWSVIMTILCCLIPGVVAIIFSSQVSTKYYSGDVEGARRASHNAEIWIIVSFVLGVLSATLYLPIMLVSGS